MNLPTRLLCPWNFPDWSGLPFPTSGHFPAPGIESGSPVWEVDSLLLCHLGRPLVTGKKQIKATIYYRTPVRMAITKKTKNKCCWACEGKETLICCWWACKLVQPLFLKTVWKFLEKLKIELWSSKSTSGYLSKGNKNSELKRCMYHHVHCSIISNSQEMEIT